MAVDGPHAHPRVRVARWPTTRRAEELALKKQLLHDRRDDVLLTLPDVDTAPACAELLRMLDRLRALWPRIDPEFEGVFEARRCRCRRTCVSCCRTSTDSSCSRAACVCFPSHWKLADKMGKPARGHPRTACPATRASWPRRSTRFSTGCGRRSVMKRRNWTIHESSDLFAPQSPERADPTIPPEDLWLRSERQTLRRLPETDAVVFTIRTQQVQIRRAPAPSGHRRQGSPTGSRLNREDRARVRRVLRSRPGSRP